MRDKELRNLLLEQPIPDEHFAGERTWETVKRAYATRERLPGPRRIPWKLLVLAGFVAAGVAIGLTSPGDSIADWVRDKLGRDRVVEGEAPPAPPPAPELVPLPTAGQLLVTTPDGVWVLAADGSKHRLGDFSGASWSPDGQFVAVWDDTALATLEPTGTAPDGIQWDVAHPDVSGVRWEPPSGFRVAYVAGEALRVIGGTGADDRELAPRVAPVAPAWKGNDEHVLAYADPQGRIVVVDDTGERQWRTSRAPLPVALEWTSDGARLVVLSEQRLRVFEAPRNLVLDFKIPKRLFTATALAVRPGTTEIAYSVYSARTSQATVYLHNGSFARPLFAGGGRIDELAWTPGGDLLLVPWPAADQWLFVPAEGGEEVEAHPDVSAEFAVGEEPPAGFPRPSGWCCAPDAAGG